jgi:signal transduction histidine kinase
MVIQRQFVPPAGAPSARNSPPGGPFFGRSLYLGRGLAWLVNLRWLACCGLFFVIWISDSALGLLENALPLYAAGGFLVAYNVLLHATHDRLAGLSPGRIEFVLFSQISLDLCVLTFLLYHAGIAHNPFVYYYVFHIIIAGILLPARYAWIEAALACILATGVIGLQQAGVVSAHPLRFDTPPSNDPLLTAGRVTALCTTLIFAAYFTHAVLGQVRLAEREIRQQDKLLTLGRLVSGIVHQIRNPLDGLKNCLHLFNRSGTPQADCAKYAELMDRELDRIEQLTERLQDYALPRPVQIDRVDVNERVKEAVGLLEIGRADRVNVSLELGDVPAARADPLAVGEIVLNLCRNALDAMEGGGRLTVATGADRRADQPSVWIEVTDTGPGIDPRDRERVFEAFYTTKDSREGSGLGLWICRTLAGQMGARLRLDSAPGRGCTFTLLMSADNAAETGGGSLR